MSLLINIISFALLAVFAENLVLTRGFGSEELLLISKTPKKLLWFGVFITWFSFISMLVMYPISKMLEDVKDYFYPLIFTALIVLVYLLTVVLLKNLLPNLYNSIYKILTLSAINSLVFSIVFIIDTLNQNLANALAYSIGAGIGFTLTTFLLSVSQNRLDNPDVPKAFRGLPVQLLYLGILSMAFIAFKGHFQFK